MAGTAENNIAKQQRFLCIILIVGIILTAVSVVLSYRFKKDEEEILRTDNIVLYDVTDPVGIHIHVDCDYHPNELVVINPDGECIDEFLWSEDHLADIMLNCTIPGTWQLSYTAPTNNNVRIYTDITPINLLVIREFGYTLTDTTLEIAFVPYYGDGTQTDQYFNYNIYATNSSHSYYHPIDEGEFVPVNTPVQISYPLSSLGGNAESIHLTTASPYQNDMTIDVLYNNVTLNIEVPDDETEETTESESTTETDPD